MLDSRGIEIGFNPKLRPKTPRKTQSRTKRKLSLRGIAGVSALGIAAVSASVARGGLKFEPAKMPIDVGAQVPVAGLSNELQAELRDRRMPVEFDLIYPEITGREKQGAFDQFLTQQRIVASDYIGPADHVEDFKAVQKVEAKIRQYAKESGVPENLLIGLVIIESKGDPLIVNNKSGAKGLTQIMDPMAEAHKMQITGADTSDSNYDVTADLADVRFNADLNLQVAASEIADAYKYWGDWALAFDEWHAGRPNIYLKLQLYFKNTQGIQLRNIKDAVDEDDSMAIREQYLQKYREESANLFRINNNEAVIAEFSGEGYDSNLIDVPRLLAAAAYFVQDPDKLAR